MTEKQNDLWEEILENLVDLRGDLLAIETFLQCNEKNILNLEKEIGAVYLCRQVDYINQHTQNIAILTGILIEEALEQIS